MIFFLPYSNLLWTKFLSLYQRQKHVFSAFELLDTHVFDPKMLQGVKKKHTHTQRFSRPTKSILFSRRPWEERDAVVSFTGPT